MKTYRLENKKEGHNKFYELWAGAYVDNKTGTTKSAFVGMRYGKIGTEGRVIFKEFKGKTPRADANVFLDTKMNEKLGRGYKLIRS